MPLAEFKALVREQFFMLMIDEEAALAAIPALLPDERDGRAGRPSTCCAEVLERRRRAAGDAAERLQRVAELFGLDSGPEPP